VELRHLPEQVKHPARAGDDLGHAAEPDMKLGLVHFPLRGRQAGLRRRWATGLRTVIGHGQRQIYSPFGTKEPIN
jgi:hypothetical protein